MIYAALHKFHADDEERERTRERVPRPKPSVAYYSGEAIHARYQKRTEEIEAFNRREIELFNIRVAMLQAAGLLKPTKKKSLPRRVISAAFNLPSRILAHG